MRGGECLSPAAGPDDEADAAPGNGDDARRAGHSRPQATQTATILHARVVTGPGGGPDKTMLRSVKHIDPGHYALHAVYLYRRTDPGIASLRQAAERNGLRFHAVAERWPFDPTALRELGGLCRRLGVTIWHGHDYKSDLMGLMLRRLHPMKLVTTMHGFTRESRRTRLYTHVDNLALMRYDHVIAVSPQLVRHCLDRRVKRDRVSCIPNAIDPSKYSRTHSRDQARALLDVDPNRIVVGVIGRFSPEKGADRAIRLMADLRHMVPAVELHLIGDGPQRRALETEAKKLGLGGVIRWWGWQDRPVAHLEAMDLLLLPSHTEGSPNVVLEAMALGVPVATTEVGAVGDLLEGGRYGLLLDPADARIWPASLVPLLTTQDHREELARRAHGRVRQHFNFETRMAAVSAVYDLVLGLHAPAAPALRRAA